MAIVKSLFDPTNPPPKTEAYGTVAVFVDLYGNLWDLIQFA